MHLSLFRHRHSGRTLVASLVFMAALAGITFAALQGQATLQGNTIETATADLGISRDGGGLNHVATGYDFNQVVPGAPLPVPSTSANKLWVKNNGQTPVQLRIAFAGVPLNPDNIDLSKTSLVLTPIDSQVSQFLPLQSLLGTGADVPEATFQPGSSRGYSVQLLMDADAFTGAGATMPNFDLVLSGVSTQLN